MFEDELDKKDIRGSRKPRKIKKKYQESNELKIRTVHSNKTEKNIRGILTKAKNVNPDYLDEDDFSYLEQDTFEKFNSKHTTK